MIFAASDGRTVAELAVDVRCSVARIGRIHLDSSLAQLNCELQCCGVQRGFGRVVRQQVQVTILVAAVTKVVRQRLAGKLAGHIDNPRCAGTAKQR